MKIVAAAFRPGDHGAAYHAGREIEVPSSGRCLGDLMTMSVRPRTHQASASRGSRGIRAYAAYELGELREALDDVAEATPTWDGFAVADGIRGLDAAEPPAAVEAAISGGGWRAVSVAAWDADGGVQSMPSERGEGDGCDPRPPWARRCLDQDFRPVKP